MSQQYLDFEQPIAELQAKIEELRLVSDTGEINLLDEIARLEKRSQELTRKVFAKLTPWQVTKMARHPKRPQTKAYIEHVFTDFDELHGDRHCSCAPALIAGIARLNDQPVMVMGHQKGKKTKEKVYRNFGMARPEGYRKALRLMEMAEKFKLPVFTFIDTAGAYPGIGAEERNQSEAIAKNLQVMAGLKTPIICTVIGEGGSGGALAIGVGDRLLMLQYSVYSVISPEGCASILWKSQEKAEEAATQMGITAQRLFELKLVDEVIEEPLGGAHRDVPLLMERLKLALSTHLAILQDLPIDTLVEQRYEHLLQLGLPD